MANESERDDHLDDIHAWIANIPCSKPRRNLTRDFSNAVLMAEVLKVYYPRYVDLHNYAPANNVSSKISNWNLLNRKVLSKIDMRLSADKIQQLANAQPGAIEQLLLELKNKISRNSERNDSPAPDEKSPTVIDEDSPERIEPEADHSEDRMNDTMESSGNEESTSQIEAVRAPILSRTRTAICSFVKCLLSWLLVFNILSYFFKRSTAVESSQEPVTPLADSSTAEGTSPESPKEEENSVSYHVFERLREELQEKNDIISSLNHKIICLENAMDQVDLRILDLTTRVLENSLDSGSHESTPSKSKSKLNISKD